MFRPPVCRGMKQLDRSFFRKTIPIKAARICDNKDISRLRQELSRSKDILRLDRLQNVTADPDLKLAKSGSKIILLRPEVAINDEEAEVKGDVVETSPWPHSAVLSQLVEEKVISIIPFDLVLQYPYWSYHDIMSAILPIEDQDELPSGFSQVGHVAHLNLREAYWPYKTLIAQVLMDKNIGVRTVINKIDDVGEENAYRTFRYEVLAGPNDMQVEVSEENCLFQFDYSKVYWNSRLSTEHRRLVSLFQPGEAVCDVMAGVGPFAVPAGKKGIFVRANDLNPDSFASLQNAIKSNKVDSYVSAHNEDGRIFIRTAVTDLLKSTREVRIISPKPKRSTQNPSEKTSRPQEPAKPVETGRISEPKTFQHFVLNLPASATTFLPSFIGLYPPETRKRLPHEFKLPLIHVYCFSTKDELEVNDALAEDKICAEISAQLQHEMKAGNASDGGVEIYDVRAVAPNKRMFCATFRLPEVVAFRDAVPTSTLQQGD